MRRRAIISCVYLGFFSQVAQVILLREAFGVFAGVEMVLGMILFVWLLGVAGGGLLAQKIRTRPERPFSAPARIYVLGAILLALTVPAIRFVPRLLGLTPGEIPGLSTSLLGAVITLTPVCLICGAGFTLNARLFPREVSRWVGEVYLWEAAGAALGGLLVTFIFIPFSTHLITVIGLIVMTGVIYCLLSSKPHFRYTIIFGVLYLLWFVLAGRSELLKQLDRTTRAAQIGAGEVLEIVDSPYGVLAAARYAEQYSLFDNGILISSYPDPYNAEEAVHFGLLSHPHPQSALLIGGGTGGAIAEALKYKLRLVYLEIDPAIIELARRHFPRQAIPVSGRCQVVENDGRRYLTQTDSLYDVIIVNLGEPGTALVNRYFTREFFQVARNHLTAGGVFSFRVVSSENYISPERAVLLASLYRTLSDVFADVVVLPGPMNIFLAADTSGVLISSAQEFISRLKSRAIANIYINEYTLPFRLNDAAFDYLAGKLESVDGRLNSDLRPISYFQNAVLWNQHFAGAEKWLLLSLQNVPSWIVLCLPAVCALLVGVFRRTGRRPAERSFLFSLAITGLTGLTMEIVMLYCFQVYLGQLYSRIGLLIACFMVGLSIGSYLLTRRPKCSSWFLAFGHLVPILAVGVFFAMLRVYGQGTAPVLVAELLFYLSSTMFGLLGGALFVIANRLYLQRFGNTTHVPIAGGYAADLFGAALGALTVSAIFIPLWGVGFTLGFIAVGNLSAVVAVGVVSRGKP